MADDGRRPSPPGLVFASTGVVVAAHETAAMERTIASSAWRFIPFPFPSLGSTTGHGSTNSRKLEVGNWKLEVEVRSGGWRGRWKVAEGIDSRTAEQMGRPALRVAARMPRAPPAGRRVLSDGLLDQRITDGG